LSLFFAGMCGAPIDRLANTSCAAGEQYVQMGLSSVACHSVQYQVLVEQTSYLFFSGMCWAPRFRLANTLSDDQFVHMGLPTFVAGHCVLHYISVKHILPSGLVGTSVATNFRRADTARLQFMNLRNLPRKSLWYLYFVRNQCRRVFASYLLWMNIMYLCFGLINKFFYLLTEIYRGSFGSKKFKLLIRAIAKIPGFLVTKDTLGAWIAVNLWVHAMISTLCLMPSTWWRVSELITMYTTIWACAYTFMRRLLTQEELNREVAEILETRRRGRDITTRTKRKNKTKDRIKHNQAQGLPRYEDETSQSSEFWLHKRAMSDPRELLWNYDWNKKFPKICRS